ncbi:MAG: phosphatase PAP2 family protein [Cytophagaceae bacterium]|nr:phosphatase PAP2 family protein [Cytophagaceae bacterium]
MLEILNRLDTEAFLWLNAQNNAWLDPVMYWVSDREIWFPFYAVILFWLGWTYRLRALAIALTIGVSVAIGDQVTSSFFKPTFMRLRPCHEPAIDQWVHLVWECGGQYGFASSHAANSFGFATVLTLLLGQSQPWVRLLYVWAIVISYSRIYVGAHYPLDVLAGAGIGVLGASLSVSGYRFFENQYHFKSL